MISKWLVHPQQFHFAGWVCYIGITRYLEARDDRVPAFVGVIDKESAIFPVPGVECQPQQSLFISAASHAIGNVEKGSLDQLIIFDDPDPPCFFNDK